MQMHHAENSNAWYLMFVGCTSRPAQSPCVMGVPSGFFLKHQACARPVLSRSKVLGLIARSLHQCCRVQFSRMMTHASRNNICRAFWCMAVHYNEASLIQSVAYVVGDS